MNVKKTVAVEKLASVNFRSRASITILSSGWPARRRVPVSSRSMATTCWPLSCPITPSPPPPTSRISPSAGKSGSTTSSLGWVAKGCGLACAGWAGSSRDAFTAGADTSASVPRTMARRLMHGWTRTGCPSVQSCPSVLPRSVLDSPASPRWWSRRRARARLIPHEQTCADSVRSRPGRHPRSARPPRTAGVDSRRRPRRGSGGGPGSRREEPRTGRRQGRDRQDRRCTWRAPAGTSAWSRTCSPAPARSTRPTTPGSRHCTWRPRTATTRWRGS